MTLIMKKDEAHKIIERMPPNATWEDLVQEIYLRGMVERGLTDSNASQTNDVIDVRAKYGLAE